MSAFTFGESTLYCQYLFSKSLLDKAASLNLKLYKQITNNEITEPLVEFVCENVIEDWDHVYAPNGDKLEFDHELLYSIFDDNPRMFIELLRFCSKIDNFYVVTE